MGLQRVRHDWAAFTFRFGLGVTKLLERRKWSRSVVSGSLWPHGLYPIKLVSLWNFQATVWEKVAISFSRGSSRPRIEPGSLALWADAWPSEPTRENQTDRIKNINWISNQYDSISKLIFNTGHLYAELWPELYCLGRIAWLPYGPLPGFSFHEIL